MFLNEVHVETLHYCIAIDAERERHTPSSSPPGESHLIFLMDLIAVMMTHERACRSL
jgi:hypothetical protein